MTLRRPTAAFVAASALVSCGGSASGTADRGGLERAVRAYSGAYLAGDGPAAYALLSPRCQARLPEPQMVSLTAAARRLYGPLPIRSFRVDQSSGNLARVTYTYDVAAIDQSSEPWVRLGSQWREDDC